MSVKHTAKYRAALAMAKRIVDAGCVVVTMDDVEHWGTSELYGWLRNWDLEWTGDQWAEMPQVERAMV